MRCSRLVDPVRYQGINGGLYISFMVGMRQRYLTRLAEDYGSTSHIVQTAYGSQFTLISDAIPFRPVQYQVDTTTHKNDTAQVNKYEPFILLGQRVVP